MALENLLVYGVLHAPTPAPARKGVMGISQANHQSSISRIIPVGGILHLPLGQSHGRTPWGALCLADPNRRVLVGSREQRAKPFPTAAPMTMRHSNWCVTLGAWWVWILYWATVETRDGVLVPSRRLLRSSPCRSTEPIS